MEKYVIYKGTEGLIHMLGGIVYCINWCIENNHKLLIDCKCNDLFNLNFSEIFNINDFEYTEDYNDLIQIYKNKDYIEQIKLNTPKLLVLSTKTYKLGDEIVSKSLYKWNSDIKIYCGDGGNNRYNINKYIRIKDNIKSEIDNILLNSELNKKNYTGLHFRNTDKINSIYNYLNNLPKNKILYIATDNTNSLEYFKDYFKGKKIISFSEKNVDNMGLHYKNTDKYNLIKNVLLDIYLLTISNDFIGSPNSLLSRLVLYMRDNQESNIFN